jgi:orotate phosphoribosyltransferase
MMFYINKDGQIVISPIDSNVYNSLKTELTMLYKTTPGCINRSDTETYKLASGAESNVYINSKKILMLKRGIELIGPCVLYKIRENVNTPIQAIGGMILGAVPIVSSALLFSSGWKINGEQNLKGFAVRREGKAHGNGPTRRVEGNIYANYRVILVEDVTTSGKTISDAANILMEEIGADVLAAITIVDRNQGGKEFLAKTGIHLHSILDAKDLELDI